MTPLGKCRHLALALGLMLCSASSALAADITLRLATGPTGNHLYYHRLLADALKAAGHTVTIETEDNVPQPRLIAWLDSGKLSLHWMLQTPERDAQFLRIDQALTQGLIGQRVLLVPKGNENMFAGVRDVAQFKALGKTAGLGKGWFDAAVWEANELPYFEQGGEWRQLFVMLAARDRGLDYFPRGASEIVAEAKLYPNLSIEPNLLLVYQRDFVFYLGKSSAALKPLVESALRQAEKSGLQKALIDEYFGPSLAQLNLDKRIRIRLRTP